MQVALFAMVAAPAAEMASAPPEGTPWWAYVLTTVGIAVAGFVVRYLETQARLRAEEAVKLRQEGKLTLKAAAMDSLLRIASNVACKELKEMQALAQDGVIDKGELHKLGRQALEDVKTEFKEQGVDIAKELGGEFLKSGLRYVVDKIKEKKAG